MTMGHLEVVRGRNPSPWMGPAGLEGRGPLLPKMYVGLGTPLLSNDSVAPRSFPFAACDDNRTSCLSQADSSVVIFPLHAQRAK